MTLVEKPDKNRYTPLQKKAPEYYPGVQPAMERLAFCQYTLINILNAFCLIDLRLPSSPFRQTFENYLIR